MNTEELKRLAEAAIKDDWDESKVWRKWEAAANPAAILALIAERDDLLKAAKALAATDFGANGWCSESESAAMRLRAAITKAESK